MDSYSAGWKNWFRYAVAHNVCPWEVRGVTAVQFVAHIATTKRSGSVIKVLRAMFSLVDSFLSTEKVLKYVQMAVFRRRPLRPRYERVWDVQNLLEFLISLGPIKTASLSTTRLRLICLLYLDGFCRAANIEGIHFGTVVVRGDGVDKTLSYRFCRPKSWRPDGRPDYEPPRVIHAHASGNFAASTPHNAERYLQLTKNCHRSLSAGLILDVRCKFSIGRQRIAKIMLSAMTAAGIDTGVFKAHSTRAAASTKAFFMGVPIRSILTRGGWSSEASFKIWYFKYMGVEPRPVDRSLTIEVALRRSGHFGQA